MSEPFRGFPDPQENWSKLPHEFIDALPLLTSLSEVKCILYVLRHTWGYQEFDEYKHITTDEFMNGRKRKDGTRIDSGVGMSGPSIVDGLKRAVEDGFLQVETDVRDLARIKKSYAIKMFNTGEKKVASRASKVVHRTEKETPGRNKKKKPLSSSWAYLTESGD